MYVCVLVTTTRLEIQEICENEKSAKFEPHKSGSTRCVLFHLLCSTLQVANLPRNAYCQPPPPGCPRRVYQLMVECW